MKVLLGITGGIAAYKAADLSSKLVGAGHQIRVLMTHSATQFIGPLTMEGLSGRAVMTDILATGGSADDISAIQHIDWAKWADIAVVAPLTASTLGRLAHGIATDALVTTLLALPKSTPLLLCPAMNSNMWESGPVQRNLTLVKADGAVVMPPVSKRLACGDIGMGGLPEIQDLLTQIYQMGDHRPD